MPDDRLDGAANLLATRGRDIVGGRIRVAAGRSGVAVGFPADPLIHVSWPALGVLGVLTAAWLRRGR